MLRGFWKKAMLRGTAFTGAYGKLRWLYSIEDPWEMSSEREQYRFRKVNDMLTAIAPRFGSILELGSGEGHQSLHLATIADRLTGVDISASAVERARRRCPDAEFAASELEAVPELFAGRRFDLVTGCEVLYYVRDAGSILSALQAMTEGIFVSNYLPRSEKMRPLFEGPGWRRLDNIVHEDTVWECFLWERG